LQDCRAIAESHVASWQQAYRDLLPPAYLDSLLVAEREARWRTILESGSARVLVAREVGRPDGVQGFVSFGSSRDAGAPVDRAEITALYVTPAAWSRGVGRELWRAAAVALEAEGYLTVSLWVLAGNTRATRFYEKAGFTADPGSCTKVELGGVTLDKVRYLGRVSALRIGVLASHEGTTLQAVIDAIAERRLPAALSVVISNNRQAGALRRAGAGGIPLAHLSGVTHPDPDALDSALLEALVGARTELVLLAGYRKKVGPSVLARFSGRIVNTHPALLPRFGGQGMYGARVHEAVLAAGERETGVSIHLVEAGYDTGRVLAQCRVPVLPDDSAATLAARVQARERNLLVETLAAFANGAIGPVASRPPR